MADKPERARVDAALEALNEVSGDWLRRPGVTAIDVGFKIRGREMTDEVALRAHVERKLPSAELADSMVFNESNDQHSYKGFPIDVVEATYGVGLDGVDTIDVNPLAERTDDRPLALEDSDNVEAVNRRSRIRPIMGGISCGNNPRVTAGTVGAVVFHRRTGRPMILSNWHVLAGTPAASIGEPVTQPGRVDGGSVAGDRVAGLSAMVLDSRMDAGVARIDSGVPYEREVLGLGVISGTSTPSLGLRVVKSGRSTGVTRGIIDGLGMRTRINYGSTTNSFTNQIRIVPRPPWPAVNDEISSGGDSGSIWMTETNRAVGLHFAGEVDPAITAENAIASPIGPIMAEFGISFAPVLRPPRFPDICRRFPDLCRLRVRWPYPLPRPIPHLGNQASFNGQYDPFGAGLVDQHGDGFGVSQIGRPGGAEPASFAHSAQTADGGCGCRDQVNGASAVDGTITLGELFNLMEQAE